MTSSLLGQRYGERIATRVVKAFRERNGVNVPIAEVGRLVAEHAAEELGELELSTVVRSKLTALAGVIDGATAPSSANETALAIVNLAQAANLLKLGENAQADHAAALERVRTLEARVAELEGELEERAPMPAGAYWLDIQGSESGDVAEVSISVGAQGRTVTAGTISRNDLAIAVREGLHLASSAIADDLEQRRRAA